MNAAPEPADEPSDDAPADALERVLGPVSVADFLGTHWERSPLHVGRDDPARFAPLVSVARIERLLGNVELRFPELQLARVDDPVPADAYTDADGRVLPRALAREHAAGATIVLSGAQDRLDALGALCRRARTRLGVRCQANVYLSPPGVRGFGPHHDAHDVFILQVAGRKTFRFHAGGPELPLRHQRFDPASDVAGEAGEEIALAPGDTLYIPRGVMHDALAGDGGASLHVTLGLFPITVVDVLHEALDLAASRDVDLRRSLGVGASAGRGRGGDGGTGDRSDGSDGSEAERLAKSWRSAARDALPVGLLEEALARLRDEVTLGSRPDGAGLLSARPSLDESAPDALPPETLVVLRADVPRRALRHGERLVLERPGQVIELGGRTARAVEALLAAGRLPLASLPGLDADERLALCRRLVDEGVVDLERPSRPGDA